jgi:hypothetical protein
MDKYLKKKDKLRTVEKENSEKTKLIVKMEKDYDYLIKIYHDTRNNVE